MKITIEADWLPTPESINKLPKPLKKYIHDLHSFSGSDLVMENFELRQNFEGIKAMLIAYKIESQLTPINKQS